MHHVQDNDLTYAIAMTDAKGDRSLRPSQQPNPDTYVRVVERRADGVVISGTKAIVTSAPYVHELLVLPGRAMTADDKDFAIACAVPLDAEGLTIVARPAGRPGESKASFSGRYGQSTGVCLFDEVFVPWERVFIDGEWQHSEFLTKSYATHHRHTCIGARAGFGDLLIGAGAMMVEANGLCLERNGHLRNTMVDLIKTVEGFYACGVAASVYGIRDPAGNIEPEPVYSNIGKLLLATQIYDMHRLAHELSGGLVVTLPNPEEDHNPETAADLAAVLQARPDVPYAQRASVARFIEDLTASYAAGWMSTISLHGGGSPEAMKREIHRRYPIGERQALVQRLMERGVLGDDERQRIGSAGAVLRHGLHGAGDADGAGGEQARRKRRLTQGDRPGDGPPETHPARAKPSAPRTWFARLDLARLLRTLAIGAVGGAVFFAFKLPLAWMLGAMVFTTVAALSGARLKLPPKMRGVFITIIGVFLGSAFTPDVLDRVSQWPLSIAGLVIYVFAVTAVLYVYFRRVLDFDPVTAYFSATPGGLSEMVIAGGALGGDDRRIALALHVEVAFVATHHIVRIALIVISVPLTFKALERWRGRGAG